jgi:phosphopantetheine adenylyltransferase
MRTVAIYPGRFHVFHRGHQAVYDHLVKQYGTDAVYIATSDKTNDKDSPFSYSDKIEMMTKMGVPPGRIVKITNPYNIKEIVEKLGLDAGEDRLIYALGAKDAGRFKYGPDTPLQLLSQAKKLKPVDKHAYVEVVPTATFNVLGQPIQSASDIRRMYLAGNDNDRDQIIADLYGAVDPGLRAMFDQRLVPAQPAEPVESLQERRQRLQTKISLLREQISQYRQLNLSESAIVDYIDEKNSRKK